MKFKMTSLEKNGYGTTWEIRHSRCWYPRFCRFFSTVLRRRADCRKTTISHTGLMRRVFPRRSWRCWGPFSVRCPIFAVCGGKYFPRRSCAARQDAYFSDSCSIGFGFSFYSCWQNRDIRSVWSFMTPCSAMSPNPNVWTRFHPAVMRGGISAAVRRFW